MRTSLRTTAVIAAVAATFAFSTPAYADWVTQQSPAGDYAYWDTDYNQLFICDKSPGNGTATARLDVIGGGSWSKSDPDGAQPNCGSATLNVDESKSAYLYACTTASGPCYRKFISNL